MIPNAVLGRTSAVFLTGEAAAGLAGAVAGPFLAQALHLSGLAAVASLLILGAASLTRLVVPRLAAIVPEPEPDPDPGAPRRTAGTP